MVRYCAYSANIHYRYSRAPRTSCFFFFLMIRPPPTSPPFPSPPLSRPPPAPHPCPDPRHAEQPQARFLGSGEPRAAEQLPHEYDGEDAHGGERERLVRLHQLMDRLAVRDRVFGLEAREHRYPAADHTGPQRSEERRVGKECRSRWSPY